MPKSRRGKIRVGLLAYLDGKLLLIRTNRQEAYKNQGDFERTQIPRGGMETFDFNNLYVAAFREFMEETGLIPYGTCKLARHPFQLRWTNDGYAQDYTVFLLICKNVKPNKNTSPTIILHGSRKYGEYTLRQKIPDSFLKQNRKLEMCIIRLPHESKSNFARNNSLYDAQYNVKKLTLKEYITCKQIENGKNSTNYEEFFQYLKLHLTIDIESAAAMSLFKNFNISTQTFI